MICSSVHSALFHDRPQCSLIRQFVESPALVLHAKGVWQYSPFHQLQYFIHDHGHCHAVVQMPVMH